MELILFPPPLRLHGRRATQEQLPREGATTARMSNAWSSCLGGGGSYKSPLPSPRQLLGLRSILDSTDSIHGIVLRYPTYERPALMHYSRQLLLHCSTFSHPWLRTFARPWARPLEREGTFYTLKVLASVFHLMFRANSVWY